jgi:transposase-like protein
MAFVARVYSGGWLALAEEEGRQINLRVDKNAAGRLAIVELWMVASGGLTGASLRDLPLGQWEATLNAPDVAAGIGEQLRASAPQGLSELREKFQPPEPMRSFGDAGATNRDLIVLVSTVDSDPPTWAVEPQLKLDIPRERKRPDGFYRQVAEAYSWLAGRSRHPASDLARENEVGTTTVHRWVKEARRRGLLGPGRRIVSGQGVAMSSSRVFGEGGVVHPDTATTATGGVVPLDPPDPPEREGTR